MSGGLLVGRGLSFGTTVSGKVTHALPEGTYKYTLVVYGTGGHFLDPFLAVDAFVTVGATATEVGVDAKPGSCPNGFNPKAGGVLSVAILGSADLDVTTIDATSVTLEGVAARRWAIEDVSSHVPDPDDPCDCWEGAPDGFADLVLKFPRADLVAAMGGLDALLAQFGENIPVTLEGSFTASAGGGDLVGSDCLKIAGK